MSRTPEQYTRVKRLKTSQWIHKFWLVNSTSQWIPKFWLVNSICKLWRLARNVESSYNCKHKEGVEEASLVSLFFFVILKNLIE